MEYYSATRKKEILPSDNTMGDVWALRQMKWVGQHKTNIGWYRWYVESLKAKLLETEWSRGYRGLVS